MIKWSALTLPGTQHSWERTGAALRALIGDLNSDRLALVVEGDGLAADAVAGDGVEGSGGGGNVVAGRVGPTKNAH